MTSKSSISFERLCCHVKCSIRTRVMTNIGLSHKLKRHHYCLKHLNETLYKV